MNLGLIDRAYDTDTEYDPAHEKTQWQRFNHHVVRLNRRSARHVQYKVLYMGRHGEGYHNVAEAFYGTPAWDVSNVCNRSAGPQADPSDHSATGPSWTETPPAAGPTLA